MIQKKLTKRFGEDFSFNNKNISFNANSKKEAESIKKFFDNYKNTGEGAFLNDFKSKVELHRNGWKVNCFGNINTKKLNNNVISWTVKELILLTLVGFIAYGVMIYFVK